MEIDLDYPIVIDTQEQEFESESTLLLFSMECEHMPDENYVQKYKTTAFQPIDRHEAMFLIAKVSRLDPLVAYLAVNYLDRFISRQEIPMEKSWIHHLLCVSCVSLASKMLKTEFSITDFQNEEEGFVFGVHPIRRMELLILGVLKWRMRPITPFSFINFFLSLADLDDPPLMAGLKSRSLEIILAAQSGIKLLEFRPSIVAAASFLSASREISPASFADYRAAVFNCAYVNKEHLAICYELIQDMVAAEKYEPTFLSSQSNDTPLGVLDRHDSSSESEICQAEVKDSVGLVMSTSCGRDGAGLFDCAGRQEAEAERVVRQPGSGLPRTALPNLTRTAETLRVQRTS